jgi:hypothetical protein
MNVAWSNFSVALGIGLLIGLERERAKGEGPDRGPAGIRTFALASLLGAAAIHLGGVVLLAVAIAAGALLTALSYSRTRAVDPGLTTEIGLVIVPLLGALAMSDPLLAAGLGVAVTVVFAAKVPLHGLVKGALTDQEVHDGLVFAIATLVVWPLLPDRPVGPFSVVNPHRIWLVVILVLAIGAAGHAALRILGRRHGLPLVGLAAGFVSSTAAIGSMAAGSRRIPACCGRRSRAARSRRSRPSRRWRCCCRRSARTPWSCWAPRCWPAGSSRRSTPQSSCGRALLRASPPARRPVVPSASSRRSGSRLWSPD